MTIVGRDAKFLGAGREDYLPTGGPRDDITTRTYRLDLGPGESRDVIFTAGAAGVYPLYDRSVLFLKRQTAAGAGDLDGYGSMRTEVHVSSTALPAQAHPNQLFV